MADATRKSKVFALFATSFLMLPVIGFLHAGAYILYGVLGNGLLASIIAVVYLAASLAFMVLVAIRLWKWAKKFFGENV